jgi:hypothetical protein
VEWGGGRLPIALEESRGIREDRQLLERVSLQGEAGRGEVG